MKTKISLNDISTHETILLYGKPKIGKTWAYCSALEKCLNSGGNVFLVNTDNGVKRTLQQYLGDRFKEFATKINYYLITDIDDVEEIIKDVKTNVKHNDLIIIDLISDFWEMAQSKFVANLSGGKLVDYYERASRDKSKFGLLAGQQWQYVKKLDNMIINQLVIRPPCKVIAVASGREIELDRIHNNKEIVDRFDNIGEKPSGQRELQYKFNTIIYIGELKEKKYFIVLGDRGKFVNQKRVGYGKDFWSSFNAFRKKEKGAQSE